MKIKMEDLYSAEERQRQRKTSEIMLLPKAAEVQWILRQNSKNRA
jgi:hypothetical protein